MVTLYLGFEDEVGLRTCRVVGSVLGTLREEEYLVAEVDPPFPGDYLDRAEGIRETILAIRRGKWHGPNVDLENHYFNRDEGIQEVISALQRGEVPPALGKIPITVACVVSPEPIFKKKIDERRLKKIGWGSIHSDPEVASGRIHRKRPSQWTFLWWRFRDLLETIGLLRERR
jgi:hypothetical protein